MFSSWSSSSCIWEATSARVSSWETGGFYNKSIGIRTWHWAWAHDNNNLILLELILLHNMHVIWYDVSVLGLCAYIIIYVFLWTCSTFPMNTWFFFVIFILQWLFQRRIVNAADRASIRLWNDTMVADAACWTGTRHEEDERRDEQQQMKSFIKLASCTQAILINFIIIIEFIISK